MSKKYEQNPIHRFSEDCRWVVEIVLKSPPLCADSAGVTLYLKTVEEQIEPFLLMYIRHRDGPSKSEDFQTLENFSKWLTEIQNAPQALGWNGNAALRCIGFTDFSTLAAAANAFNQAAQIILPKRGERFVPTNYAWILGSVILEVAEKQFEAQVKTTQTGWATQLLESMLIDIDSRLSVNYQRLIKCYKDPGRQFSSFTSI